MELEELLKSEKESSHHLHTKLAASQAQVQYALTESARKERQLLIDKEVLLGDLDRLKKSELSRGIHLHEYPDLYLHKAL